MTISENAQYGFVYGYASVDLYRILHDFALDPHAAEFKAPLNRFGHARGVASAEDRTVVAMNVDTPYSYAWLDLRAEPVVVTLPSFEADRYVSAMFVDLATYILGYVSPRTNGNRGGRFLVTGSGWSGDVPPGIDGTFACPTALCLVFLRTQMFGPDDLDRVAAIQDGCDVQPLSVVLGQPSPDAMALPPLVAPVDVRREPNPRFFEVLSWMVRLMPAQPEDDEVRSRLASAGLVPYRPGADGWADKVRAGMGDGLDEMHRRAARVRSSAELFGSREQLGVDPMSRAMGAMLGILGNSAEEYLGVGYQADADGRQFDGRHRYAIRFAGGDLPPVDAFWSITLYDADRFLYANAINRYSVSSKDLSTMLLDDDGGITVHVSHDLADEGWRPNWLPCPDGPFNLAFRTYLPGPNIRDGRWVAPPVQRQD
jgi:hypothetical protein